jgi:hypothetical protein
MYTVDRGGCVRMQITASGASMAQGESDGIIGPARATA